MAYIQHPDTGRLRSWLDAGLTAHREGDIHRAIAAYRQALVVGPENADTLNLLGTGLLQVGETAEAVSFLERATRKQKNNPRLLANLAQCYIALNRYGEACETFRKASRIEPQQVQFQLGVATALALQGQLSEAQAQLQRLAARFPASALVWFNLGNVMRDQKRPEQAIAAYRRALEMDPQLIDARNSIGSVLHSSLRFAEAEAQYRECIAYAPGYLISRYNLASVIIDLGRFEEAEAVCRDLVARDPGAPEAHSILGAAIGQQGRLLEALACHEHAARLAPDDPKFAQAHAATLMETGHEAEGLRHFARALALSRGSNAVRQLLATVLLAHGNLQEGWTEYGCRPPAIRFREKYADLALTRSFPQGLQGKHVCVLREQGLGDEIFFLRYAPLLAARGARITYRASNKIASLLSRLPCIDRLVEEMSPLPAADANILVGDLPHALGELVSAPLREAPPQEPAGSVPELKRRICTFWPPIPRSIVLEPRAERVGALRGELAALGPPPYIGVTWRAGTAPEEQNSVTWVLYKTIDPQAYAAAFSNIGGTVVALQRRPGAGEINALSAALGRPVHDLTHLNEDLEGMLALLALIDDYVGVSNTNMHLRAAVGRTARVLVPVPAEWRWMQSGRSSPWFPGFSIYRQSLRGHWSAALAALKCDLEANYGRAGESSTP